jgi:hypothetical protein
MAEEVTTTDAAEAEADTSTTNVDTTTGSDSSEGAKVDHSDRKTWESEARKHEARSKKTFAELERVKAALAKREEADKSEHEKAIDAARKEAADAARSEVEKERRHDRLELAVTRESVKTFADSDDALIHLERGIRSGDIDEADIFDSEGKVQTGALRKALEDLLGRKPHLAARVPGPGENDAGKGSGSRALEDMSVEEHFTRKQGGR